MSRGLGKVQREIIFHKCRSCGKESVNNSGCCIACGHFEGYLKEDTTPKFWAPLIDKADEKTGKKLKKAVKPPFSSVSMSTLPSTNLIHRPKLY